MKSFVELAQASDEMIESILNHVDHRVLAVALQGVNAGLIGRILGGRSPETIAEVLSSIRRQQVADVDAIESARRQIAEMVEELESVGSPARD
jgi:flagellar motor switch protein FliG